jgi:hypothetical protein
MRYLIFVKTSFLLLKLLLVNAYSGGWIEPIFVAYLYIRCQGSIGCLSLMDLLTQSLSIYPHEQDFNCFPCLF